jgi:hypothetical protein
LQLDLSLLSIAFRALFPSTIAVSSRNLISVVLARTDCSPLSIVVAALQKHLSERVGLAVTKQLARLIDYQQKTSPEVWFANNSLCQSQRQVIARLGLRRPAFALSTFGVRRV